MKFLSCAVLGAILAVAIALPYGTNPGGHHEQGHGAEHGGGASLSGGSAGAGTSSFNQGDVGGHGKFK